MVKKEREVSSLFSGVLVRSNMWIDVRYNLTVNEESKISSLDMRNNH